MQHTDENAFWADIAPTLRRLKRFEPYTAEAIELELSSLEDETLDTLDTLESLETERVVQFVLERQREASGRSASSLRGDQFVDLVSSTGVLSPSDLRWLARRSREGPMPGPRQLTEALLEAGKLPRSTSSPDRAGAVYGDYLLLDEIGFGGMGRVYRAVHLCMDRIVALKVLRPNLLDLQRSLRRFQREIKAIGRLEHPHIVTAYDANVSHPVCYLAMEYVDGCDLSHLVHRHNPLPMKLVLDYTIQAARGLEHAHQQHIIHRDVKPSNLLLGKGGVVKVSDLGLARFRRLDDQTVSEDEAEVTEPGAAVGTHSYMAPEQYEDAQQVDERSDIYSLGCTLFFLLAGQSPVHGLTVEQKIAWHRGGPIPSLTDFRNDVPLRLEAIFRRMVARSPQDRYASMGEVIAALTTCQPIWESSSVTLPRCIAGREDHQWRAAVASSTDGGTATITAGSPSSTAPAAAARSTTATRTARHHWFSSFIAALAVLVVLLALLGTQGRRLLPRAVMTNSIGMRLVHLPAGQLLMGADDGDESAESDEYPRHPVVLSNSFYLGAFEVTREQFNQMMERIEFVPPEDVAFDAPPEVDVDKLPVTHVSWYEAQEYCRWLSNLPEEVRAGRQYRLPTEAEWEYACRAGTKSRYHLGDEISTEQVNFGGQVRHIGGSARPLPARLMEVGSFAPNEFGLFDMHGNVWEWCLDRYGSYPAQPAVDPGGPALGDDRVVRGGGWSFNAAECRSANRQGFRPDVRNAFLGFRVVCEIK